MSDRSTERLQKATLASEEGGHMQLPKGVDGEIVIRWLADGIIALDGWVGSFDGHRRALDSARQAFGARVVHDRVAIVLGAGRTR